MYASFLISIDVPKSLDTSTLISAVAALVADSMNINGYSTLSHVGLIPSYPRILVQTEGYVEATFQVWAHNDTLLPISKMEAFLATAIVGQLSLLEGHPANVAVTLQEGLPQAEFLSMITPLGDTTVFVT